MSEASSDRKYFYGIDAVRFSAALMVVLFHLGRSINNPGSRGFSISQGKLHSSLYEYVSWGSVGVEIFFVISGLVIANSANGASAFHFLRSRVERLYPAVWICATISLLAWLFTGRTSVTNDVSAYVHTMTLFPLGTWIDAPYWTLAHEVIFYACVWLLLLTGRIHHIEKLAIAISLVALFFWGGRALQLFAGITVPGIGMMATGVFRMLFPLYGGYFALGVFLWIYFNARLSRLGWLFTLISLLCCLAPFLMAVVRTQTFGPAILVWLAGLAAIILSSRYPASRTHEGRSKRLLRTLGLATYPLYLVHFALGGVTMRLLVDRGVPVDLALVLAIMGLIAVALWIATQGEPAIRRQIRTIFNKLETSPSMTGRIISSISKPNRTVSVR